MKDEFMKAVADGNCRDILDMMSKLPWLAKSIDKSGATALFIAVMSGQVKCAHLLVEYGAEWSFYNRDGTTPLCEAVQRGYFELVQKILSVSKPENVCQIKILNTALIIANARGQAKIVQLLLSYDANVRGHDEQGRSALMHAAEGGFCDVVRVLLKHGADPSATDPTSRTALHHAAAKGQTGAVRCLLSTGTVEVNATDKRDRSALFYAAENGQMRTVRELLTFGADLNLTDNDYHTASDVANIKEIQQLLSQTVTVYYGVSKQSLFAKKTIYLDYADIPVYLHNGAFYQSLDAADDSIICIPLDCYRAFDRATRLSEFAALLRTIKFWMLDRIPDGVIEYCFCYTIADWRTVAKENCDPHSTEYRDLCAIFSGESKNALARAIRANRVEIVEYLAVGAEGERSYNISTVLAARLGKLESLRALHKMGVPWDKKTCAAAAAGGHLECLKYAHEHGCEWDEGTVVQSVVNGHVKCLDYAFENSCPFHSCLCVKTVQGGNWDCVKYLMQYSSHIAPLLCSTAASYGHLYILQQLHLRGVPWDINAAVRAAKRGHVECLQYLHENGCPWNVCITSAAASAGKIETLRYAIEHGCPYLENSLAVRAAMAGSLPCLSYLLESRRVHSLVVARAVADALKRANGKLKDNIVGVLHLFVTHSASVQNNTET